MNTRSHTHRAAAFGFAAVVTLSMLASVNLLATQPVVDMELAHQDALTQLVVVDAQRGPKS